MSQIIHKESFIYSAITAVLNASGQATVNIDFEADSTFVWQKTTFVAFDAAGAPLTADSEIIPNVNVFMRDTGSGKNLMQLPVNIAQLAGNAKLPYMVPLAYQFEPKSTLQVQYTNNHATAYSNFGIVLHGVKLYTSGR